MESKTKPAEFLAEFPKFAKYLASLAKGKIQLSELEIIKRDKNVRSIRADVGDSERHLGELSLVYEKSKSGENLVTKSYHGAIKTRNDVYLIYHKYFDSENSWGRMDGRFKVPFP
jgi:hypothetical protein